MLYSCIDKATVGVKGLRKNHSSSLYQAITITNSKPDLLHLFWFLSFAAVSSLPQVGNELLFHIFPVIGKHKLPEQVIWPASESTAVLLSVT